MVIDTEVRLRRLIAQHLGVDELDITPDAHFVTDLNGDSVDLVELLVALEDEFGLSLSAEEGRRIRTLRGAALSVLRSTGREEAA
jgi:acyl carrier protein